jgi:hypothetical protein
MLNRWALIVRPAQPYIDWATSLDDSRVAPDPNDEQTVYLIQDCDDEEDAWHDLRQTFATIFENELYGWHTDEELWPRDRTFEMFKRWFKFEFHSIVIDIGFEGIEDDDIVG